MRPLIFSMIFSLSLLVNALSNTASHQTSFLKPPIFDSSNQTADFHNSSSLESEKYFYVHICKPVQIESESSEEKDLIDYLYTSLRSFFTVNEFHDLSFERSDQTLRSLIAHIDRLVGEYDPCRETHTVFRKFRFAERMYLIMRSSLKSLKQLDDYREYDQILVQEAIRLNVRILSLYDENGEPNFADASLSANVAKFLQFSNYWSDAFTSLENPHPKMIAMFENQIAHVNYALSELQRAISAKRLKEKQAHI